MPADPKSHFDFLHEEQVAADETLPDDWLNEVESLSRELQQARDRAFGSVSLATWLDRELRKIWDLLAQDPMALEADRRGRGLDHNGILANELLARATLATSIEGWEPAEFFVAVADALLRLYEQVAQEFAADTAVPEDTSVPRLGAASTEGGMLTGGKPLATLRGAYRNRAELPGWVRRWKELWQTKKAHFYKLTEFAGRSEREIGRLTASPLDDIRNAMTDASQALVRAGTDEARTTEKPTH